MMKGIWDDLLNLKHLRVEVDSDRFPGLIELVQQYLWASVSAAGPVLATTKRSS